MVTIYVLDDQKDKLDEIIDLRTAADSAAYEIVKIDSQRKEAELVIENVVMVEIRNHTKELNWKVEVDDTKVKKTEVTIVET